MLSEHAGGASIRDIGHFSRVCNPSCKPFSLVIRWSVAFHLAGTYLALRAFQTNEPTNRIIRTGSGIVAVMLHGAAVIVAIDAATDLSLGLTLMLACVGFAMATVLVLNQLRKAASHLEVFVFPLSAVSSGTVWPIA